MSDLTAPAAALRRRARPSPSPPSRRRPGSTTRRTTRTPAASPSWPTPAAAAPAPSSPQGLTALHNLDHRGAAGSEPNSGDGAGILTQVPDALLRAERRLRPAADGGVLRRHRLPAGRRGRARRPRGRRRAARRRGGPDRPRLARRAGRPRRRRPRPHRPRGHAALRPAVRRRDDGRAAPTRRPSAAPSPATG